jgi:hypothetical protein
MTTATLSFRVKQLPNGELGFDVECQPIMPTGETETEYYTRLMDPKRNCMPGSRRRRQQAEL